MEENVILSVEVDSNKKKQAEEILSRLGIPMEVAIEIYLRQIVLNGKIPFPVQD